MENVGSLTSLINNQIKIIKYHVSSIETVKKKFFKGTIFDAGKGFWKPIWGYVSRVLKIFGPFGLIIPFLRIYPKEIIIVMGKDLCTQMFLEALFITVENGSNLNNNVTRLLKQ